MTSYIKFTALTGTKTEAPLCYLLEIDEAKILLDCGWTDSFNVEDLKALRRIAKQVDALLISHADVAHLGAYPYARSHLGLTCPVYGTLPVASMGKLCMYDLYQSKRNEMNFDVFSLEDVENAFDRMVSLRYSQPTVLPGKCKGIIVTAYAAGHTVGGTLWKIKKDTDEIVYAVDFNHQKERHLDGTVLLTSGVVPDALVRPSLMITDAQNAEVIHPQRKLRDEAFLETIMNTLENKASVLLPTDSSTRVLELAYLLDQHWTFWKLKQYPLIFLTNTSQHTIHYAKIMLEWMGGAITRQFSQSRENPFDFKYVRLCQRIEELDQYPGPKVVLASNLSLDTGFARELFTKWMVFDANESMDVDKANDSDGLDQDASPKHRNAIILTDRGPKNSLARHLYEQWESMVYEEADDNDKQAKVGPALELRTSIDLTLSSKVKLEGAELQQFQAAARAKAEREAAQAAILARSKNIMEEDVSDDSDSEAELDDPGIGDLVSGSNYDLYVKDVGRSGGFFRQSQSYRMFPFFERRKKFDDYGEVIVPDHYLTEADKEDLKRAKAIDGSGANFGDEADILRRGLDQPILQKQDDFPTKFVTIHTQLQVDCIIRYIDIEGVSDGRSLKQLLFQILVHGDQKPTDKLAVALSEVDGMTKEIFTPNEGEVMNVSAATNLYQLKLTDALVSRIKYEQMDDYELAYVNGKIHFPEDSTTPVLEIPEGSESSALHTPVLVGDARLSEFRRVLQAEGIHAEFKGEGVLVCNDQVAVRKTATGQLLLEGVLSNDYFRIRSLLYAQHAIV
ncbi:hypothetical protein BZG36_00414 [Bifiguratus adelaidae]|uniref:Cleavage and polyadenylation specificity factor subunit 2 n=1 Tax=Bifiguratus adelaidae TaxID=1938954 RepID=A0A261Y852_9FUNG|nr:hypothetical protein BZG36_00414 [Bifiguratus adelaidae]